METNNSTITESKPAPDHPVHVVRRGAVAASIWQRQTQAGSHYYEYTLSRSWKSKDGERQGYSLCFFSRNVGELSDVINEATRWIATKEQAALAEDSVSVATGREAA